MNAQLQAILQQAFKYTQQGNYIRAKPLLEYVLKLQPKNFDALHTMGFICGVEKNHQEASNYSLKALKIRPDDLEVIINYAKALQELGKNLESVLYHKKAIALSPDDHKIWLGCGKSFQALGRYEEAITHYDKALTLKPDFAEGWSNKGVTLNELKRFDEAITHFNKALSLKTDYAKGWSNKGVTLNELKRFDEAITHFDKALSLQPEMDWIYGELIHTKARICSWPDLTDSIKILSHRVMANEKVIQPFSLISLNDDSLIHKNCAEKFIKDKYPRNDYLGPIQKNLRKEKIRLGYFSADFKNHATGYLLAELFELHHKNQFELIGFSFGPTVNDEMRQRLKNSCDQFIEVGNKSDMEVAQLSRQLNIDIAVDLKGFTQDSRTGIFSYRAAPIQVNYLGYPGTMGSDYIDYIVADKTLIPPESQSLYSEKVVYLPNSYQANDRKRVISDRIFTKQELGLPENGFIFCCLNNNFKMLPSTFDGWVRILKAVEGSVLWLFQDNHLAAENLRREAERLGIDTRRLVFAEHMPLPEHLARQRMADLFLDTFPCNAHTTTSDALWVGLPVLTLTGQSFASRVAASLLNAIGLPELIAATQEEYEATAIELANNPQKLLAVKQKLANNRLSTPLFDAPLFTRNIETAYIKIHERYLAGLEPDHILI